MVKKESLLVDILLIILGCSLGIVLSNTTKNYKNCKNRMRWPKYIELIDSLVGIILLLFLVFHLPLYRELLTFFLSMNVGFHMTNVF